MADVKEFIALKNIADDLEEEVLKKIGTQLKNWFDADEDSRRPWKERSEQYLRLATQVVEKKSYPWPDSANVKFPLLTTAAMQFQARAYPALVPSTDLVTAKVIGKDQDGQKAGSAERIGRHMSYQLLYEMDNWEEDMDKLCLMLPIVGCVFKKSYYDPEKNQNRSDLVLPQDFVIDYYAKSVEDASRKHHIIYRTKNKIIEKQRAGIYRDVQLGQVKTNEEKFANVQGSKEPELSPATPYKLIECHCWWDLDKDEYEEPYIITYDYDSGEVLRIVARFDADDIVMSEDGKKIARITPKEYFTKFGFIPNPDGSIYDLGFGLLLGGINETVNTLTNQLLDSGTLSILQAGFLGKGIRIRSGNSRFSPGEWKPVDFTGDDIKKQIFPLPTKEPSDVLFKLLEALVTSGKELASIAEIFVGKMPGQNTPATTTMATIEQGLKVFTAIYKRIYRALGKEYEKLFNLNAVHMDEEVYVNINVPEGADGVTVYKEDYAKGINVKPNADPNVVSNAQKLMKVQAVGQLLQMQTINPQWFTKRYLEALEIEDIEQAMNVQPQPNPEMQKAQMEAQLKAQEAAQKAQLEDKKAQIKIETGRQDLMQKAQLNQIKADAERMKMISAAQQTKLAMQSQEAQHQQNLRHAQDTHVQAAVHGEQGHQQNMQHADQAAKQKAKAQPPKK